MARISAHNEATVATVPVSTAASVLVSASGVDRTIANDSDGILYLKFGTEDASIASFTLAMAAASYYEVPFSYGGPIQGIWAAAATGNGAHVTSLTGV